MATDFCHVNALVGLRAVREILLRELGTEVADVKVGQRVVLWDLDRRMNGVWSTGLGLWTCPAATRVAG